VSGVFLLETLQTALDGADLYYWFASGFGNIDHLTSPYATPFDVPMTETLVSLTVQFFFMHRIMVLSQKRSWWLCVFILLVSNLSPEVMSLEILITPVVFNCRWNCGVLGGCLCKLPPFHVITEPCSTTADAHPREVCHWTNIEDARAGKVIK
jgi:hypothetical protein